MEALAVAHAVNAQQRGDDWSERRAGTIATLHAVLDALQENDATALRRLLDEVQHG